MLNWDCLWHLYFWDPAKLATTVAVNSIHGPPRVIYCPPNMGPEFGVIVIFEMSNNIILKKRNYILQTISISGICTINNSFVKSNIFVSVNRHFLISFKCKLNNAFFSRTIFVTNCRSCSYIPPDMAAKLLNRQFWIQIRLVFQHLTFHQYSRPPE